MTNEFDMHLSNEYGELTSYVDNTMVVSCAHSRYMMHAKSKESVHCPWLIQQLHKRKVASGIVSLSKLRELDYEFKCQKNVLFV